MTTIIIRKAVQTDLPAITDIYNEAILNSAATFDTQTKTVADQQGWFEAHQENRYPLMVAERAGQVVGWASLSHWSDRCAYNDTAEISVYVLAQVQGQGIGKQLIKTILQAGQQAKLHTVLARITDGNKGSVRLHERFGFEKVGIMREVGLKFGKRLDVHIFQLMYKR